MDDNKPLYIGVNSPDSDDRIAGFGDTELMIIGGMCILTFLIGLFFLKSSTSMVFVILTGCITIALTALIIRKDMFRENLIKKIWIVRRFINTQKRFEYEYINIYEGVVDLDEEGEADE